MLVFLGEEGSILAPPVFLSVSSTASRNLVTYLEQGQGGKGNRPEGFITKQLGFCGGKLAEMIHSSQIMFKSFLFMVALYVT